MSCELVALSEKALLHPVIENVFKYCPSMDLLALATEDQQLSIYRLNGQKVSGNPHRGLYTSTKRIQQLQWKPNGTLLAIGSSEGFVRLVSADHGKIVHQIQVSADNLGDLTCIGWGSAYVADGYIKESEDDPFESGLLLSKDGAKTAANLPRSLALVDIESSLPKLSVLPAVGSSEDIFSSRSSIDAMFHGPIRTIYDAVDVLFLGFQNGLSHLTIYDSFVIGSFDSRDIFGNSTSYHMIRHCSTPSFTTHALLMAQSKPVQKDQQMGCFFVPMDLRFVFKSGDHLPLLAAKSTQLQNLLRYLLQVQLCMHNEWKAAQDLPSRFLRNVNESLAEKCYSDFVHAAYHLAATGDCYPPMKEWLVEELMERGHKRWEKAVNSAYDNIRRLAHECLLPCLERCTVVASRLRGLARYQGSNVSLGLSHKELSQIISTVNCLSILGHTILKVVNVEQTQFSAFSAWLRHQIDLQSSDSSEPPTDDLLLKEASFDYHKVLGYIQGPLVQSKLGAVLDDDSDQSKSIWSREKLAATIEEDFKAELRRYQAGRGQEPGLLSLIPFGRFLQKQAGILFDQVAEAQRRNVLFGTPFFLGKGIEGADIEMRMCDETEQCVTYIAVRHPEKRSILRIVRILLEIKNGVTSSLQATTASVFLEGGSIIAFRFLNDHEILAIWQSDTGSFNIIKLPYSQNANLENAIFQFVPVASSASAAGLLKNMSAEMRDSARVSSADIQERFLFHTFEDIFEPQSLDINGREGRKVVCVLSNDRLHYRILDLEGALQDENED